MQCLYLFLPQTQGSQPVIQDIFPENCIILEKQECIPVGCVPSATVAVCYGGVPAPWGGCLIPRGVPAPVLGVSGPVGGGIPACTEADGKNGPREGMHVPGTPVGFAVYYTYFLHTAK